MKHPAHTSVHNAVTPLAALIAGLLVSSCVTRPQPEPEPETAPAVAAKPKELYQWNGKGRMVSHIKVNIDEQKVIAYSGKEQIGWATVATGITKYPTPVGDYKVIEKVADKKSNLFGKTYSSSGKLVNSDAKMGRDPVPEGGRFEGAHMPYYLRLTGDGVGMHAGPIPSPGHRASHGCIRMPRAFAPLIFASVGIGTPVNIVGEGPSYTAYMKKQQEAAARLAASRPKKKTDEAKPVGGNPAEAAPSGASGSTLPGAPTQLDAKPAAAAEPAAEIKPAIVPQTSQQ